MKISFECDCILLQKTLLLFCFGYASSNKDCDFVVSDRKIDTKKPLFLIGDKNTHLSLPFTKNTLISTLWEFYSAIQLQNVKTEPKFHTNDEFEKELDALLDKFKKDLISLIRRNNWSFLQLYQVGFIKVKS